MQTFDQKRAISREVNSDRSMKARTFLGERGGRVFVALFLFIIPTLTSCGGASQAPAPVQAAQGARQGEDVPPAPPDYAAILGRKR